MDIATILLAILDAVITVFGIVGIVVTVIYAFARKQNMERVAVFKSAKRFAVYADFSKHSLQIVGELEPGTPEDQLWIKYETDRKREEHRASKGGRVDRADGVSETSFDPHA